MAKRKIIWSHRLINKTTVTVQIETNTAAGLKLITELRRYPDVIRFVEPDKISETVPEGYVPVKDGFDEVRNHVKSFYSLSF